MFPSLGLHGGQAPSHGVNTVSKYRRKDSAIRVSQSPSQPLSVFLGGGGGVLYIYFFLPVALRFGSIIKYLYEKNIKRSTKVTLTIDCAEKVRIETLQWFPFILSVIM